MESRQRAIDWKTPRDRIDFPARDYFSPERCRVFLCENLIDSAAAYSSLDSELLRSAQTYPCENAKTVAGFPGDETGFPTSKANKPALRRGNLKPLWANGQLVHYDLERRINVQHDR